MTKKLILPSKSFRSLKEATNFFSTMLNSYEDGAEINATDSILLHELLTFHPDAEEKIGISGVKRFYRDKTGIFTSCFFLERNDGSKTEFAYPKCISGRAPTREQEFYRACRHAVSSYISARKLSLFSDGGGTQWCSITGESISISDAEYRHTSPTFQEIVQEFIDVNQIDVNEVPLSVSCDLQFETSFLDSEIAKKFQDFHKSKANFAVFKKYVRS